MTPRCRALQVIPMGQLVWHLNHTACIRREPPFLEYAPLCRIGLVLAVAFTGIGVYGSVATHFVSAKAKPGALRLVREAAAPLLSARVRASFR